MVPADCEAPMFDSWRGAMGSGAAVNRRAARRSSGAGRSRERSALRDSALRGLVARQSGRRRGVLDLSLAPTILWSWRSSFIPAAPSVKPDPTPSR